MAAITICQISYQSVRVQLTGLSKGYNYADRTCKWYIGTTLKKTESLGAAITAGAENSLTGLDANTTYTVKAVISGTNMTSDVTLTKTFSTSPGSTPPATLSVGTITQNSIQIKLTSIEPSDYTGDSRAVHWWKNGTEVDNYTTLSNSATSTSHTFTGLTAGTSYTLGYSVNANNWYAGSSKFTISASTEAAPEVEISYVEKTRNSITVKLINLSSVTYDRYVIWSYSTSKTGTYTEAYTNTTFTLSRTSSTSDKFTIGDLNKNTSYYIKAVVYRTSNDQFLKEIISSSSYTTTNTNVTISFSSITNNSFAYTITGASTYYSYSGYAHLLYGSSGDSSNQVPSSGTIGPITVSGLSSGTNYSTELVIRKANSGKADNNTVLLRQSGSTITTLDATISVVKTFQNALEVKLIQLDTSSNLSGRYVKWYYGTTSSTSSTGYDGTTLTLGAGVSEGGNFTIGDLSANTTYYLKAEIYNSSGSLLKTVPKSGSTFTKKTDSAAATINCTSQKQSSLTFEATNLNTYANYTRYVHWYYKTGSTSEQESTPSNTLASDSTYVTGHQISGLTADTIYTVRITVTKANSGKPDNGAILVKTSASFSTLSGATINANAQGPFSIYAQLTNLDDEYTSNDRQIKWQCYKNNVLIGESNYYNFDGGISSTQAYGIRGLAQGTTYTIKATVRNQNNTWSSSYGPVTATTVSNGNFVLSSAADTAVRNHGATTAISVSEWNGLVNTVNNVIGGKGWTWDTDSNQGATLTAENTKASSSDKTLYASMFNSLRYNIGKHYSTGINKVRKWESGTPATDQIVYGAYFVGGTVNNSTVVGLIPALNGLMNSEQIHFTAPS